jgi:uncharacterized protein DUF1302
MKMKSILFLTFFLTNLLLGTTLFESNCYSEECNALTQKNEKKTIPCFPGWWNRMQASIEGKAFFILDNDKTDYDIARLDGIFTLELEKKWDKSRLFVKPFVIGDTEDLSKGVVDLWENTAEERPILDLEEAYFDFSISNLDLRIGRQIIKWGKGDLFNPTNNINPTDFTDLFDSRTIGVNAINADWYLEPFVLEAIFVPTFTPSRLPLNDSRFSLVPDNFPGTINPRVLPDNDIEHSQFGLQASVSKGTWDASVNFYYGTNDFPAIVLENDLSATPMYVRERILGFSLEKVQESWILRAEGAQFFSDTDYLDSYFQYKLGFEKKWKFLDTDKDLITEIYYIGETVTDESKYSPEINNPTQQSMFDSSSFNFSDFQLDRVLSDSLIGKLEFDFSDYLKLNLGFAYRFDSEDYYIQPKLEWEPSDNTIASIGFDVFEGPRNTFFGKYKDDDRLFMSLKRFF